MSGPFYRLTFVIGQKAIDLADTVFSVMVLLFRAVHAGFRSGSSRRTSFRSQISRQVLYSGVEAFWLVGIIALLCGCTIVIQSMTSMPQFGVTEYFGNILIAAIVREMGPFFTALVVVGRSGSALAAHIGTMRVNKEISALEVMGVDPVSFIVVPSLVGLTVSMVCLNLYFDLIAIIGGLLVAKVTVLVPFNIFLQKVLEALSWIDILISVSKGIFFGIIISVLSCYYGLEVTTIRGVPQSAISAVVGSMAVIIILNVLITIFFYIICPIKLI